MTDSFALSARPPFCAIAWATKTDLFCEIPCIDGPPLIVRYPLTAEGLRLALNIIVTNPEPTTRQITAHPKTRFSKASAPTDAEREGVRAVLQRLKII